MKNCGAALYFDPQTDASLRQVWQQLADEGLPSQMLTMQFPPHMTVMTCEDIDIEGLRPALTDFIASFPPITLRFHSVATFTATDGVVYLAPVFDQPLMNLHAVLWDLIRPYARNSNILYAPGYWVPHITMNMQVPPGQIGAVVDALLRADLPSEGQLTALFIAEFWLDTPAFKELYRECLCGEAR